MAKKEGDVEKPKREQSAAHKAAVSAGVKAWWAKRKAEQHPVDARFDDEAAARR